MQFQKSVRRIKARFLAFLAWLSLQWQKKYYGVDEKYIDHAYRELCQIDTKDWVVLKPGWWLNACGNSVHFMLVDTVTCKPTYQFIMHQSPFDRRIYVQDWRDQLRFVTMEFGFVAKTNWWEVYRSGRHLRSRVWLELLKQIYGDPKCPSRVKPNEPSCSQTTQG